MKDIREKFIQEFENFQTTIFWRCQKSGSKRDSTMDQTETLDYTDEYSAHLIGLELRLNLDRLRYEIEQEINGTSDKPTMSTPYIILIIAIIAIIVAFYVFCIAETKW